MSFYVSLQTLVPRFSTTHLNFFAPQTVNRCMTIPSHSYLYVLHAMRYDDIRARLTTSSTLTTLKRSINSAVRFLSFNATPVTPHIHLTIIFSTLSHLLISFTFNSPCDMSHCRRSAVHQNTLNTAVHLFKASNNFKGYLNFKGCLLYGC